MSVQRVLVTYDICDPKRLRAVFQVMKGFGDHLQFSVFRCDLSAMRIVDMKRRLRDIIDASKDQVLIIDLGPAEGRGKEVIEALGRAYVEPEGGPVVV